MSSEKDPASQDGNKSDNAAPDADSGKQCRICLDGEDSVPELGRLIRPCLCKGTISYVHVKCLQQWRTTSSSKQAFYSCAQCGYRYHFARTRVVGIATNTFAIATLSTILFTLLVYCSSFVTTSLLSDDGQWVYAYDFYLHPYDVVRNLVRTAIGVFVDDNLLDRSVLGSSFDGPVRSSLVAAPPGILKTFIRRFLLGLPVVGAGSIAHMLLSVSFPFQLLRMRARRGRSSGDVVAVLVLTVVLVGAIRALYQVFKFTERLVQRLLLRAEDAILEVS